MSEGALHFSDTEDKEDNKFQLQAKVAIKSNEGIVSEQEGNISNLTNSDPDHRRLIEEFYAQDGIIQFSDSRDEVEEEAKVTSKKEETKVMTWEGEYCSSTC